MAQVFQWWRRINLRNRVSRTSHVLLNIRVGKDSGMLLHVDRVIKVVTDSEIDYVIDDLLLSGCIWSRRKTWRFLLMFLNTHTMYTVMSWSIYFIAVVVVKIIILLLNRCLTGLKFITSLIISNQVFIHCNLRMWLIETQSIDRLNDLKVI